MRRQFVINVSKSEIHSFSKERVKKIVLVAGLGIEGDAHFGATVKHRSRVKRDPSQPNLRQVHLVHNELFDELAELGFEIRPGDIGDNITTCGIDLLNLPVGTELVIGSARIRITGLRNPCSQLDEFQAGLMAAVLDKKPDGRLVRKAGIMGVVVESGIVEVNDAISIEFPAEPYRPLQPV